MRTRIVILMLSVLLLFSCTPVSFAAGITASGTMADTVHAGDTFEVAFSLSGKGILGISAELSYSEKQLTLVGVGQNIGNTWVMKQSGNNILLYDNAQTKPVSSNTKILTVTFRVKETLAEGTKIECGLKNLTASDGNSDFLADDVLLSRTLAAPETVPESSVPESLKEPETKEPEPKETEPEETEPKETAPAETEPKETEPQ